MYSHLDVTLITISVVAQGQTELPDLAAFHDEEEPDPLSLARLAEKNAPINQKFRIRNGHMLKLPTGSP